MSQNVLLFIFFLSLLFFIKEEEKKRKDSKLISGHFVIQPFNLVEVYIRGFILIHGHQDGHVLFYLYKNRRGVCN